MEHEITKDAVASKEVPENGPVTSIAPSWSFYHGPAEPAGLRGGGCTVSTLHDCSSRERDSGRRLPAAPGLEIQMSADPSSSSTPREEEQEQTQIQRVHNSWPGWAELENDPEIFTILLQEWGMQNVKVNEVYDITELLDMDPASTFGLIFLSRYVPIDRTDTKPPLQANDTLPRQPWFTNQISKFSCGTVALINILMNIQSSDIDLSEALSEFKNVTHNMDAKHRGITLDNHPQFRDIHNSFSTKLDQLVVDVMLKDEANKARQKAQAQARNPTRKRKRTTFTKRRKYKVAPEDEEENGFHFVAYVAAHGSVWKLDGLRARPVHVGIIDDGQTWLNVTVQDVFPLLQEALDANQQCTMMSVTHSVGAPVLSVDERARRQDDWAPFIETLLRIHAEKGDLNDMLGY